MSRKTKKQKIIADYRRKKLELVETAVQQDIKPIKIPPLPKIISVKTEEIPSTRNYTIDDLKKTIVITSLLLGLEIFVFYANLK